jgi:hypothetical protein
VVAAAVDSVTPFIGLLPPLGFFTNGVFALFTLWLPELFPTAQRSFGAGFAFRLERGAGGDRADLDRRRRLVYRVGPIRWLLPPCR